MCSAGKLPLVFEECVLAMPLSPPASGRSTGMVYGELLALTCPVHREMMAIIILICPALGQLGRQELIRE